MANGTIQGGLSYTKSGRQASANFNYSYTQSGSRYAEGVMDVGTSDEQLLLPADFGTPGRAVLKNLDSDNYLEVGHWNSGTPFYLLKIGPGESYPIRFGVSKTNIAVKADTAGVQLEYLITEE